MNSAEAWVSATKSCGIAVMAKASAPGRTKTRLVPPLTCEEAAAFNTAFLQDIAANILAAAEGPAYPALHGVRPARARDRRVLQGRAAGRGRAASKPGGLISATACMAPSINC